MGAVSSLKASGKSDHCLAQISYLGLGLVPGDETRLSLLIKDQVTGFLVVAHGKCATCYL